MGPENRRGKVVALRQLRYFEAVARLGSLNRASFELGVTQPALTHSLTQLETTLGCQLFARQASGSFLTREGEIFLLRVRRALRFIRSAVVAGAGRNGDPSRRAATLQNLTTPQIAALTAIDALQSFPHAAEQLGISTSALNRHARELELTVGQSLFTNHSNERITNRAGRDMAGRLRLAFREIEAGREEVSDFAIAAGSSIVIGMLPIAAARLVSLAIEGLARRFSHVWVKVLEGPFESLEHWLRSGQIDIVITTLRDRKLKDLHQHGLFEVPYSLVVREGHPLVGDRHVTNADICRYEWILPRAGTPRRAAAEALFTGFSTRPPMHVETSSLTLTRQLLLTGDRITIFSREQSLQTEGVGALTALNYQVPGMDRMLGTVTRTDWLPTAPQQYFVELINSSRYHDL